MNISTELFKISQITDNIFVSGVFPLDNGAQTIEKLKIKYILSCINRNHISHLHDGITLNNPNITILYLPYYDITRQNLWEKNENHVSIFKSTSSNIEHQQIEQQLNIYNKKPLIEIGYHFINKAVSEKENILIHCMAGISRSISVTAYYLMKKYHMNFSNSINFIKKKRSIAKPNDSFKSQLEKYYLKKDKFTENDAELIILLFANK